jgi:formylglycine-generating enzyme required for sulfatase activity
VRLADAVGCRLAKLTMIIRIHVGQILVLTIVLAGFIAWASTDGETGATSASTLDTITNSIGMRLARIPAGIFEMGSPHDELEREAEEVLHPVTITKPFYMGVYEVTQAEFAKLMDPNTRATFHSDNGGGPDHPMENVLWIEADEFCKKLTAREDEKRAGRKYRLPTESEWEYACRAGTTTAFHFGDSLSSTQANINGDRAYGDAVRGPYRRMTAKVGSYEPNALGLYDMHGNVAEWVADWYDPEYYNNSPGDDPLGPPLGTLPDDYGNFFLVARGGSWLDDARACRSAYRMRAMHRNRYWLIGFRVACDVDGNKSP